MPHDPQPLNLDAIDTVIDAATPGPWGVYQYGGDSLIEIAADLEDTGTGYSARRTICRFDEEPLDNDPAHREWTAEEDWAQVQADAAFIAAMSPETVKAMADEIRRLRARVWELERPAVEKQRDEVRDSYAQLAAQCREDRDHESAFDVECRLREREEQWAREDAAACPGFEKEYQGVSDAKRRLANCKHCGQPRTAHAAVSAAAVAHVVADDSDNPEHIDDCPGCEAFTLAGHRAARP
ncbi:hypothetical protein [Streptomyces sp. NPDC048521]|uniref:hypothetical protein n=1 Tax=Streptomyces sp. NPDC048521 TaxID=3365566 RepID=UPI00371949C0